MVMKVKEFIDQEIDIDVYDDYDERCGIAFVGAQGLTPEGKKHFSEVLEYNIDIIPNFKYPVAVVHCDTAKEAQNAKEFFHSAAGYCSSKDWEKWFI